MQYIILFAAVAFNVLTNIGFKFSALNEKTPVKFWTYFAIGLVFGLINSYLFTESLKSIPLGIVSAIFFSLTVIGLTLVFYTAGCGYYFLEANEYLFKLIPGG